MKKKFICINTILCLILSIFLSESKANSKSWIYSAISQVKNIVLLSENETNTIPEKYDLRDDIEISVKNQYHSGICSDCATASQYETHIKLRQKHGEYDFFNKTPIFSVLGSTKIGAVSGVYTNGEPFSIAPISIDDSEKFLQEEYDKEYTEDDFLRNVKGDYRERNVESELKEKIFGIEQNFKITKKIHPEHLYKTYGEDGALTYKDEKGNILDKGMVTSIRNKYKKYIMEYGGLVSGINTEGLHDSNISDKGIYDGEVEKNKKQVCFKKAYKSDKSNHAILIIGWDDSFAKENFPEEDRPIADGAYIAQNSWGSDWGDNGIFYISYEDKFIEKTFYDVIQEIEEYKDTEGPVTFFYENNGKTTVKCFDRYGTGVNNDSLKYLYTEHNLKPSKDDENWVHFDIKSEIDTINNPDYLWIMAEDNAGNITIMNNRNNESSRGYIVTNIRFEDFNANPIWRNEIGNIDIMNRTGGGKIVFWSDNDQLNLDKMVTEDSSIGMYTININQEGKYMIYIACMGEKYEYVNDSLQIMYDNTKPKINVELQNVGESKVNKILTGTIVDDISGLKSITINNEEVELEEGKLEYKITESGKYTILATDNAGNEAKEEIEVNIPSAESTSTAPQAESTTKTIIVTSRQENTQMNILKTEYAIYRDGKWSDWQTDNEFNGLVSNTIYKVKTRVEDELHRLKESEETEIATKEVKYNLKIGNNINKEIMALERTELIVTMERDNEASADDYSDVNRYNIKLDYGIENHIYTKKSDSNEIEIPKENIVTDGKSALKVYGEALDINGKVIGTTNVIILKVVERLENQTVVVGQNVTFKANVVGGAEGCTYTWYENNSESTTGGVRIENPEGNSSTYTVKATEELSGKYYYCVITKDNQTVVTNAAKLTVTKYKFNLIINEMNSKEVIVKENTDVTAKLVYTGTETIENADKYKICLEYGGSNPDINIDKNGGIIPGTYIGRIQQGNIKIRGEVLDSENNIIGTTEVSELIVLGDIENQTVIESKEVTFEVQITGETEKYGYQWYRSDSNSTETGTKIENATDKSYKVKATEELDGKYYYCEVTNNDQTITTNAAKLTVIEYKVLVNGKEVDENNETHIPEGKDIEVSVKRNPEDVSDIKKYKVQVVVNENNQDTEIKNTNESIKVLKEVIKPGILKLKGSILDSEGNLIGETKEVKLIVDKTVKLGKIEDKTVIKGEKAEFETIITEDGNPAEYTYQWYENTKDSTTDGTKIEGATGKTYTIENTTDDDEKYYYCVVKNGVCETVTNAAKLTVKEVKYTLKINGNSEDEQLVLEGEEATAVVEKDSEINISQYRITVDYNDGTNIYQKEFNSSEIKIPKENITTSGKNVLTVYVEALDANKKVIGTTNVIILKVVERLGNQTVVVGQNVTFKANVVGGAEGCTYTWYENNSESTTGGVRIENPEGNSSTYTVKATEELSGKYYYCVITKDNQTVVTNAAKLTVTKYKFDLIIDEMNSKEVIVKENTDVTAKLVYTGTEAIENADKYKIYLGYGGVESTIDLNKNKIMIPGSYIEMIQQRNIKIRGEVLDSENNIIGTTEVSELIVLGDIENQTVIENKEVTFEVQITGEAGKYGYQWYRSDSNSTEAGTKIENATDKSYKVKATEELDGKYYYCEVTNNNQTITTNAAKLTITQDIEGPIIKGAVLSQEEWSKENKTITITAEDESGVAEYGVSNSNEVNPTTWSTSNIIEISENAIYYVWAKDSKGNISCLNTPIESKIDKVAPKIEKIEVQNLEIVVTGIIDEESGVEKISISKESGKYEWVDIISNNYRTGQLAVGKYYIAVKDKAGNIVEKSIEIKETKVLVSDIEVEQEVIELNSKQKSKKINVTIKPENATNKQLKWTSSNENIVKVDKDGIITAVADGEAKITIETMDGSKISKIVNVIVKEHTNPTKIELEGKSRIRKGEKSKYTVKYTPEGANINTEVIWSISNEEIATINEKGEVVGQKAGKVKVIGTLKNISNIVAEKEIEVYYENPTTAEPNVEVTTNSIKVENRQKNEYAKIVEIKYGISEDGENWKWQEGQTFDGLKENKEYKIRTKVKDENGVEIESEYVEVKTKELVIGKIVLKKNKTEDYEESSWVNGNISYEIIDENNMTTVKVLNEEGKEVEIKENTISENGIYTIVVETTDGVNRKTKEYKVKIDKGTAEIEIEKINGAQQKSVKLKIYMKKSISGIKTVKINGKEIEHNSEECIYEVNKNGSYKIEIEDNAGNVIEKVVEISNIIKNEENNGNKDEEKTERTDNSKENNDKSSIKVLPKTGEKKAILGIIVSVMILLYAFYKYNKNKIK